MDFADALREIAAGCPREPLHADCVKFLRNSGASDQVIAMLNSCGFASPVRLGKLWLSRLADADRENIEEQNAPCIENGFLIVGSGLNGDPVALELRTGAIAFISHDMLWEGDYESFPEVVVRTPLGFQEFWLSALTDPAFPRDSYDARTRWSPGSGAD